MAKTLDRFLLRDMLSDSSAGTIYRAEEKLPGENLRPVALKVLPPIDPKDEQGLERFSTEVKVLAQLSVHPNVVTVYSMGITDNYPWLAMEYSPTTVNAKITDKPADIAEVIRLLRQVGEGLSEMHGLKPPLIHQDLKPANVLVDAFNNYKITDFSLATMMAARRTQGLATVRYAAPELLSAEFGKVGPATDLYALGHMAYEMALGSRDHMKQFPAVFEGNANRGEPPPNKWMMWHASTNTKPALLSECIPGFSTPLAELINRLMAKQLSQRYAAAREMLNDLTAINTPRSVAAVATANVPPQSMASAKLANSAAPIAPAAQGAPPTVPSSPINVSVPPAPPALDAGMAAARYWVRLRGKVTGPYDVATLQRQVRQGAISRLHQVSSDGVTWKGASELEGLYGPTAV